MRVPSEQRVFSLILALVSSPIGLTKSQVLQTVYGYAGRAASAGPGATSDTVALERQFERDKAQLRELGVPIEVLDSPLEPGNNQLTRYRVSKALLETPAEARFSARELMLLRLAAVAWREGSLTVEARRSAMKIEALGAGLDVRYLGIEPRIGLIEPAAAALQQAIDQHRNVAFDYQLPSRDTPLSRRLSPLRLHRAEGRWHLIAHDLDRSAERVFLLSRVVGSVRLLTQTFDPGLLTRADATIADLERRQRAQRVTVHAEPGSIAEARMLARRSRNEPHEAGSEIEFGALDTHELASELAGYGDEVVVSEPVELRERVAALLATIAEQHAGSAAEPPSAAQNGAGGEDHG